MLLTIIVFLLILGVLIFVHELGHFLTARRNGVKAEEFGFGFPPRIFGVWKNEKTGKWEAVFGNRDIESKNTVYSLNIIPLGGFVKIKGEDRSNLDQDSLTTKSAWIRVKVLGAGVVMNFLLAWIIFSTTFMIGAPTAVDAQKEGIEDIKIQISQIAPESPAEKAEIKVGDEILGFSNIEKFQKFAQENKGKEIEVSIQRGKETKEIMITPREVFPEKEGPLGVAVVETALISYPWYESIWKGLLAVFDMVVLIVVAFFTIIKNLLFGQPVGVDVSGPVGIAVLTRQVTELGLIYVLQFTALLSINLGIINAIPFPALDGGRILFILIEKIKGSPVTQKTEQLFHTVGFFLLIALMVAVTLRDVLKFFK